MELIPFLNDRLKGANHLTVAHEAVIHAGDAIMKALDVLIPDDDDDNDEPVYGEGQVAVEEEAAVRGRGPGWHMEDRLDGTTVCRACSLRGGVHDFVLLTSTTSAHWTAHAKAACAATDQPVDYAASSAGRSETPPPPSCWRCEGMDEEEALEALLGLCHRHAADERAHARKLSVQLRDSESTVRAQAVALRRRGEELEDLRSALAAIRAVLPDAP